MKNVRLNNGVMMPAIGFGVYRIPADVTERCVSDALEVGYRMIDTAAAYLNEKSQVLSTGFPFSYYKNRAFYPIKHSHLRFC